MTEARYTAPVVVHPDRYGNVKSGRNRLIALHTSEQTSETPTTSSNLANYMTQPGDRPTSSGGVYGSSYAAVFDVDLVRPCVPYNVVSYSASGANSDGVHGCFPGTVRQTRDQWLDTYSRALIRTCAAWMVDVGRELNIPLRRLTATQVVAGDTGYCDHATISAAYHKTDHSDVGPGFPWDVLAADIVAVLNPAPAPVPEDPDVEQYLIRDAALKGLFSPLTDAPVSKERRDWLVARGVPIVEENHPPSTEARLHKMGPTAAALYGRT